MGFQQIKQIEQIKQMISEQMEEPLAMECEASDSNPLFSAIYAWRRASTDSIVKDQVRNAILLTYANRDAFLMARTDIKSILLKCLPQNRQDMFNKTMGRTTEEVKARKRINDDLNRWFTDLVKLCFPSAAIPGIYNVFFAFLCFY